VKDRTRLHDGIVGVVVTLGCLLGFFVGSSWFLLPALIGVLLIQSYFTGFCPVYYTLDRIEASKSGMGASKSA
jgi:hypothetical protein